MQKQEKVSEFSETIEKIVSTKKLSYFDAIIYHCEQTGLEPEVAAKLVSPVIKAKITKEAQELNFIPKSTTKKLPLRNK